MVSCDGIGDVAEFTRKNLNFSEFVTNLDYFREFASVSEIWSVLSVPSILTYDEQVAYWSARGLNTKFHIMSGNGQSTPVSVAQYSNELFLDMQYPHKEFLESAPKHHVQRNRVSLNFLNAWPERIRYAKNHILYT